MRKSIFLTLASVALLLVGCSKDELTENVSEGVSSVATPTNGHARLGNTDAMPEIWFNQNQGRMVVQFSARGVLPQNCRPSARISYTIAGGEDPDGNPMEETVVMEAELLRVGNSRIYRSAQNEFVFGQTDHFSLVDVKIDWNAADGTLQEESRIETQLFLYPSGRTVEQDPKVVRLRRFHVQDQIVAEWDATLTDELRLIVADDPAQQVAQVKFVPEPIYPYADDPTYAVYPEPSYLEKSHENTNLGLSRWTGSVRGGAGSTGSLEGTIYMIAADGQALETNFAVLLD